jgi:hypothetical protein
VLSADLVRRVATPWFVPVLPAITFTSAATRPFTLVFPSAFASLLPNSLASAMDFRSRASGSLPGSPERALSFGRVSTSYASFSAAPSDEENSDVLAIS